MRRAIWTALYVWRPWTLWRELRLAEFIRIRRILLPLMIWIAIIWVPSYFVGRTLLVVQVHQNMEQAYPTNTVSLWHALRHGVLLPRSRVSPGPLTPQRGAWSQYLYPYPRMLYRRVGSSSGSVRSLTERNVLAHVPMAGWIIFFAAVFQIFCAASFVAMPTSLKRARIRPQHIARIWAYSLYFILLPILLLGTSYGLAMVWLPAAAYMLMASIFAAAIAVPLMTVVWWRCAVRRYLRLPESWIITIAVVFLSVLATALVVYLFVQPGDWEDLLYPGVYLRLL